MSMLRPVLLLLSVVVTASGCANLWGVTADEVEDVRSDAIVAEEMEDALAVLDRMSDHLAGRSALRYEAEIGYDAVQLSGQKIEFGSHRRVALRRPGHARVEVIHRDGARELIAFDGQRLTAVAPDDHAFASVEIEGSVPDALDMLSDSYGYASPLSDLLRKDLAAVVRERAIAGQRIGIVSIDGTPCTHLAFEGERVDFQLFVSEGEEPVPLRFLIDYHDEDGAPQFRASLRNWELDPDLPDALFGFLPPAGAQRVPFQDLLELLLGPLEPEEETR